MLSDSTLIVSQASRLRNDKERSVWWEVSPEVGEQHQADWLLVLMYSDPNARISKFALDGNSLDIGKSERY